mmetsp:Transcript_79194/g.132238  ORF Transcript_79194/g.132238 Transcript_79194/m.132238 type:complete len:112 (+) Transcript_79194:283-618(+)
MSPTGLSTPRRNGLSGELSSLVWPTLPGPNSQPQEFHNSQSRVWHHSRPSNRHRLPAPALAAAPPGPDHGPAAIYALRAKFLTNYQVAGPPRLRHMSRHSCPLQQGWRPKK